MDFDNMSREELIKVLKRQYIKVGEEIPGKRFKVGMYYLLEQTGDDDLELINNHDDFDVDSDIAFLTFADADKYLIKD